MIKNKTFHENRHTNRYARILLALVFLSCMFINLASANWNKYSSNPLAAMMLAMMDFMGADSGRGLMDYNSYMGLSFPFRSGLGVYPGLGVSPYALTGNPLTTYANPLNRSILGTEEYTKYPVTPSLRWVPNYLDGRWYGLNGEQLELRRERYIMVARDGRTRIGKFTIQDQHILLMNPKNKSYQEFEFLRNDNTLILKGEYGGTLVFEKTPSPGSIWDRRVNPSIRKRTFNPAWNR